MNRAVLIVLDSVGAGELPDAADYGDVGSNTLKNIYKNKNNFSLPNLENLGLLNIDGFEDIKKNDSYIGSIAKCNEQSKGKDTTTGHWEISGIILDKPFPTYPDGFPDDLIKEFEKRVGRKTIGNCVASGTEIIKELGKEHVETGSLIVYTSADSVFQIAAHEEVVPLDELYNICKIARELLQGEHSVGRVIARPFIGTEGNYTRTGNRRDFSLLPPSDTMLDYVKNSDMDVFAIGKIEDIFVNKGITRSNHTHNNEEGIEATIETIKEDFKGLIFTNLVDFDMIYGHRNNIDGYAGALKYFDDKLPEIIESLKNDDILIITADHGCDPTTKSTDHSREYIPLLFYGKNIKENNNLGILDSFADIGKTILELLRIDNKIAGNSVAGNILR
ncbi:phosphopentomutase [Sedimentibacter hydroxybenzoicus DSM 7310]|uniref:Phosphopentomutase n=1 Tax=Sedimentibacter hydroxybenzoicus DSM 7310 TaxID=1123245 RepID=A0A974BI41_SEDHY|nr:phosphopentomutase [Sedimentibacter hydroxybenzoicus]NYB73527.1 phosphopentomutase [Sedimentibacter hydroxybenzoicus DSM 7310]